MTIDKILIRAKEIINSLSDEQMKQVISEMQKLEPRAKTGDVPEKLYIASSQLNEAARAVATIDEEFAEKKLDGNELFKAFLNRVREIGMQTGKNNGSRLH